MSGPLSADAKKNRQVWDDHHSRWFGERGARQWAADPHWGIWEVPDSELHLFPDDLAGKDLVDLGCGTAYIGAWAAARGARPVGVDNSAAQLATAHALQERFGVSFPLLHASAEQVPLPDACFDVAVSEHGAITWCDPYAWIPEAARLLRPGGELIFLRSSTLLSLCGPDGDDGAAGATLRRAQAGMYRAEHPDGTVEFQLPTGPLLRLLRQHGFVVEDLVEVYPPAGATSDFGYVDAAWATRWPSEEVWKARFTG